MAEYTLDEEIKSILYKLAEARAPREACGIIMRSEPESNALTVVEIENVATGNAHFMLDPDTQLEYWDHAVAIWHSHPTTSDQPSELDLLMQMMAYGGRAMVIVSVRDRSVSITL